MERSSPAERIIPVPRGPVLRRYTVRVTLPLLFCSAVTMLLIDAAYRPLALPVLVALNVASWFVVTLWNRDRQLPVFEVGTLWMLATVLYSTIPFLGFMVGGLQWNEWSDNRLLAYEARTDELAAFAWRYVLYMASFAVFYLVVRGRSAVRHTRLTPPSQALVTALVSMLGAAYAFKWLMRLQYGVNLDVSYVELAVQQRAEVPYWLAQVMHNAFGSLLLFKMAVLIVLMLRWRSRFWRSVLILWLAFEVVSTTLRMGSRSATVLLLLSAVLLFHRLVRPLSARCAAAGGVLLLSAFLLHGLIRGSDGVSEIRPSHIVTRTNEFQALFATAFDIYKRKEMGTLPPVPWQIYAVDAYLIIPSQLLPFYKWDPAAWYLEVAGLGGLGVGFMFGVISQSVLGLDWLELFLRGTVVGVLFALFHRWYVRHATGFWPILLYLFVGIWTYYTFRATSFWFIHFVVYQFLPVAVGAHILELSLTQIRRIRVDVRRDPQI